MTKKRAAALRLIAATAVGVAALSQPAHACEFPVTDLSDGVIDAWGQRDLPPIPRNAAFVWSSGDPSGSIPATPVKVATDSSSQAIMGRVSTAIGNRPGVFIAKPDEPMPPGVVIQSGGSRLTTGDYIDEKPPDTPRIVGGAVHHEDNGGACGGAMSSCAGLTSLGVTLAAPANDDRLPAPRVAYLVYLEKSADAARDARTPFALVSEAGTINQTSLYLQLDASWVDSDAYVSVSSMDWAANESPRSEPYQVSAGGSGCALSSSRRYRAGFAIVFATLAGLAWIRRRTRR